MKWKIVTNGKVFRIKDSDGAWVGQPTAVWGIYCGIVADEFPTYEKAKRHIAVLEQKEKDNTWVEVE